MLYPHVVGICRCTLEGVKQVPPHLHVFYRLCSSFKSVRRRLFAIVNPLEAEPIETKFGARAIELVSAASLDREGECIVFCLIIGDAIEVGKCCTVFFNIKRLTSIMLYCYGQRTVFLRGKHIERAARLVAIHIVARGIGRKDIIECLRLSGKEVCPTLLTKSQSDALKFYGLA